MCAPFFLFLMHESTPASSSVSDTQDERVLTGIVRGTCSGPLWTSVSVETDTGVQSVDGVPTLQCPLPRADVRMRVREVLGVLRFVGFGQVKK